MAVVVGIVVVLTLSFTIVQSRIDGLENQVGGLNDQIDGLENQVGGLNDQIDELNNQLANQTGSLEIKIGELESQVTDLNEMLLADEGRTPEISLLSYEFAEGEWCLEGEPGQLDQFFFTFTLVNLGDADGFVEIEFSLRALGHTDTTPIFKTNYYFVPSGSSIVYEYDFNGHDCFLHDGSMSVENVWKVGP